MKKVIAILCAIILLVGCSSGNDKELSLRKSDIEKIETAIKLCCMELNDAFLDAEFEYHLEKAEESINLVITVKKPMQEVAGYYGDSTSFLFFLDDGFMTFHAIGGAIMGGGGLSVEYDQMIVNFIDDDGEIYNTEIVKGKI